MKQICIIVACIFSLNLFGQDSSWKYLGQTPPGDIPLVFAKGIISTRHMEHSSPSFSPDLKEVYWSIIGAENIAKGKYDHTILYMKYENKEWSDPDTAFFSGQFDEDGPIFSPKGDRLFFSRNFSDTLILDDWSLNNNLDIFYINKKGNGWNKPVSIGDAINTEKAEWLATVTNSNNIYFQSYLNGVERNSGIYCSEYKDNQYQKPYPLSTLINSNEFDWTPFIAPDESYIIFSSSRNPENNGNTKGDLYISFKNNNEWSKPIYMGNKINTEERERFPSVSPDGKYLFFKRYNDYSFGDIMWVDAKVIDDLKKIWQKK